MTTKEALIVAGNVVLAAVGILLFAEGKMPAEQLALVLGSIGFPSAALLVKKKPDVDASNVIFVGVLAFALATACVAPAKPSSAPSSSSAPSVKTIVHDGAQELGEGCKIVDAVAPDGTAHDVCATAGAIAQMVSFITAKRADAGAPSATARRASCTNLPDTTFCATNAERFEAVSAALANGGAK